MPQTLIKSLETNQIFIISHLLHNLCKLFKVYLSEVLKQEKQQQAIYWNSNLLEYIAHYDDLLDSFQEYLNHFSSKKKPAFDGRS